MIAARGHHLMTLPWIATNELQGPRVRQYQDALRSAGHALAERDIFVMYPIYVGADDTQARAEVIEHWHRWRSFALEAMGLLATQGEAHQRVFNHLAYDAMVRDSRGVFGGPESCTRILRKIIEVVGATHIGLTFHFGGLSQDKVLKSMERFAQQVRPAL
jgi:alkanesulfonate monooxygenase SsuD/methylene tetrahydromethanopterin reductase-like flavin-dependent oxidoreductase (luciferase family)